MYTFVNHQRQFKEMQDCFMVMLDFPVFVIYMVLHKIGMYRSQSHICAASTFIESDKLSQFVFEACQSEKIQLLRKLS